MRRAGIRPKYGSRESSSSKVLTMGMNQTVRFPSGHTASWPAVRDLLISRGLPLQVRMIDGELAFPKEEPNENWRELRLATQEGMAITVKRAADVVELVVWGNADQTLIRARNAITWAFAEVAQGMIQTEQGAKTAQEFEACCEFGK
jgi:hypothetical protein